MPPKSGKGKRATRKSPSRDSDDSIESYQDIILQEFRNRHGETYNDAEQELEDAIEDDAELNMNLSLSSVLRRQAMPPLNVRPTARPDNEAERESRRNALRDQIAAPHAIGVENLNRLLQRTGWDVIRATALFRREDQIDRITNPTAPLIPGLPPRRPMNLGVNQNRGHGRASVPESRRAALAALYINMQQAGATTTENNHTVARFLRRHRWDFRAALQDYLNPHGANRNLAGYRSGATLRSTNPTQYQQDERLAEFLNLVSIDSIFSARELLRRFNFDVSKAYDEYVRLGRVPFLRPIRARGKPKEPNNGMREVSVEYGPDNAGLDIHRWARGRDNTEGYIEERVPERYLVDPNPHFAYARDPQPPNIANPPEYPRSGDTLKLIIDPIPRGYRPQRNCPNPLFLRIESICRGKYKMAWKEPGSRKNTKEPHQIQWDDERMGRFSRARDFDWRSQDDIDRLAHSVGQELLRAGFKVKEKPEKWHYLEEDFLWRQFAVEIEKLAGRLQKGALTIDDLPPKISQATKERIAAEMNAKFEGKQVVDDVDMGVPRPRRTEKSINTARGRVQSIMDDFHTKPQPPRGGQDPEFARPSKRPRVQESSSEKEEDDDDDDDDDSYHMSE